MTDLSNLPEMSIHYLIFREATAVFFSVLFLNPIIRLSDAIWDRVARKRALNSALTRAAYWSIIIACVLNLVYVINLILN